MKKGDAVGMGESLRILTGKYAGLVGSVEKMGDGKARLYLSGIWKGEPLDVRAWFALSSLGRNHG